MSKTVLVADESVTIRSVAESLLRGEAYSVRSAADGNMAMELAKTEKPDLVLVGEQLPGMSGAEVCAALKADPALHEVPVVFMRTDRPGSAPSTADEVLTKPFSPQSLLDLVHRFLKEDDTTSALPIGPVSEAGMADELIDQALGIDDVGPAPAEEMEVNRGGELGDLNQVQPEEAEGGEEEAPAFGTLEEEPTSDAPTVDDSDSLEFSTQVGLEDATPTPSPAHARDADLERALDLAFGGSPAATSQTGAPSAPAPIEEPPSSLDEISLGEPDPAPPSPSAGPDAAKTPEPAPARLSSLDDEPEPERPHDYDWFIKEMEKESAAAGDKRTAKAQDRPRIEPVVPEPPFASSEPRQEAPFATDSPGPARSSAVSSGMRSEEIPASKRGYDEFISEFRKEIAKLEGALPPDEKQTTAGIERATASGAVALPDAEISAPPSSEVRDLADRLIDTVTMQVARELAAKIDSRTIYALIEQKLKEQQKPGA